MIAQRWPFCWWAAVVLDHFSRKVIVASVWGRQPTAVEVGALLDGAVRKAGGAPKYIISDQGTQFREEHLDWCSWHEVQPRFASMITSKAATNDHLKTGHHEVTETGSV